MDCKAVQQHAGDAIDRSLPTDVEGEFQAHLERCPPCKREVALEKLSKYIVQQYVRWVTTPRHAQNAVLTTLQHEYGQRRSLISSVLARLFSPRLLVPALPGFVVMVLFYFLVATRADSSRETAAHTDGNDIINQSLKNFSLLQSGKLTPAVVSQTMEGVGEYLQRSDLRFCVQVPRLKGYEWCSGSASEEGGIKQAHIVYKIGPELLYMLQLSTRDALSGSHLSLPPDAKKQLVQSGWYTDPTHPECSVVLWKTDQAVCVAVSTMKKGRLLALLTTP